MYCRHCGANNELETGNCAHCGKPLQWQVPQGQFAPNEPIKNYLVESILATIFCCQIPGIVGIVYAAQVNGLLQTGDYAGAQNAAQKAKNWTIGSFVIGLIFNSIYLIGILSGVMHK